MKKALIILCSIYAGSALSEPISLLCKTDYYFASDGHYAELVESFYIDIEKEEMLKGDSLGKNWEALEDVRITKVAISGYNFYDSDKTNYHKYTVNRTNLELNNAARFFYDSNDPLPKGKCEIADFDIETAF